RLFLGERNAISMLKAGFTTMRDLGNSGNFLDAALDEQLNHQYTARPNLVYSGPGISYKISQINSSVYPSEYKVITDNTTAETLFSDYKKNKATWIKLFADSSTRTDLFEISKLNEIIAAAHRIGFKVALHAENSESEHLALMTDADSIEHFYELPSGDTKQPINNKPTIVLTYVTKATCENLNIEKNCLKKIESLKQTTAWLREHGFKFVFGSDAVLDFSSKFKERGSASLNSLTGLIELGFNNSEILKFATVNAAELLGLKTGQIKKDYKADFVVLNADPLVDIKNLYDRRAVISGGKIFCQTEKECAL
ncbi:MAG: amidohydrolase family protein, partial [Pseudobdellovibrio sp.]